MAEGNAAGRPELLWSIFCDHFMVDQAGKYSFIGVFERVGAVSFPAVHKVLYLVCSVRGTPNARSSAIVNIWSPDVTLLLSTQETPLQFGPEGRTILVHLLYDLNFATPGAYTFALEVGGKPIGEAKLDVYQAQPPQQFQPR
jgi:hypothetical protein